MPPFRSRPGVLLQRVLRADPSLVVLPAGVQLCRVFRNAVTIAEEGLIAEELGRVLTHEGQPLFLEGSTPEHKIVKHTYLEMFGTDKEFTEVKNWQKKETRRLPGLTWSPTLLRVLRSLAPPTLGALPDTARVVEHNMPGYEMHVEHPTVGPTFLYLNLLCDTVMDFDDEATGRHGQVLLPARSFMVVSGEARWGFRFGETAEDIHVFETANGTRMRVEMDLRLGIQLWKLDPRLLDSRMLQERIEETIETVGKRMASDAERKRLESQRDQEEAEGALLAPGVDVHHAVDTGSTVDPLKSFMSGAIRGERSVGLLGGEHDPGSQKDASVARGSAKALGEMREDYGMYKEQFSNIQGVLQEMKSLQDAGQPINDLWLQKKIASSSRDVTEKDRENGFDPNNIEGTWDNVDAKARFYKAKLKKMDYDGTAFLDSTMPDISSDAPLDMKATIRKMAPHVKDGEKILASLPRDQGA